MLSFHICLSDLQRQSWTWSQGRWANGRSWIEPVGHPLIDAHLGGDSDTVCVVVQERRRANRPPTSGEPPGLVGAPHQSPGDHLVMFLRPGELRIAAGPLGMVPLYVAAGVDVASGSWWIADLRPHLQVDRLCARAVARALTRQQRYCTDTLFGDVQQLTERATAVFNAQGWSLTYPRPAQHVLQARQLRPDIDAVQALDALLGDVVADVPIPRHSSEIAVELSGGADSANVALTLAQAHGQAVRSFGLVLDDPQQRRRAALRNRFVLRGHRRRGARPPALRSHRGTGPRRASRSDRLLLLRGLRCAPRPRRPGGCHDHVHRPRRGRDLRAPRRRTPRTDSDSDSPRPPTWLGTTARDALDEIDEDLAPVSAVPLPTLLAGALHNPGYLRRGIWPIAPLAHPVVVRFFEQLPARWRRGKALLRTRLRRAGLCEDIVAPDRPETFTPILQSGLREHGLALLDQMLSDSVLIDTGYVDPDELRRCIDVARGADRIPSQLADTLAVEIGLRSLVGNPPPAER